MSDSLSILERNLSALYRRDPHLLDRMADSVRSDQLRIDEDGWSLRWRRGWYPLSLDVEALSRIVRPVDGVRLSLLGAGDGTLLKVALEDPAQIQRITLWEPDPYVLRAVLGRVDVSEALHDGRLRLMLGADLLRMDPNESRWVHPVVERLYERELAAFLHDGERVLVVEGELVVEELLEALARQGAHAWTLSATRDSIDELGHTARMVGATRLYSINYLEGLTEFANEHGLELFVWEIDPVTSPLKRPATSTDHVRVFCHRRANIARYLSAGYRHVEHLPLATDAFRRVPQEVVDERYRVPLAFVGSSLVANADVCRARFLDGLRQGVELDRETADAVLERLLSAQANELEFILDELWSDSPFSGDDDANFLGESPVMLVGEVAGSARRLEQAQSLAALGLAVWGDEGWEEVSGLDVRGPAGHTVELDRVHAGATLVVDLSRLYQPDIVTLRVFDAMAVGAPVLAPWSEDLEACFEPGVEVLVYTDTESLVRVAREALADPERLAEIARRGRERVLREHTIDHRLETMHALSDRARLRRAG